MVDSKDDNMNSKPKPPKSFSTFLSHIRYEHLLAGVSGGVTSSLILHPLDLIKIRFAVNDGRTKMPQYQNLKAAFVTIFRQEGVRGLYRGVGPNMWGSGTAWGFYFLFYNGIKNYFQDGDPTEQLSWPLHMVVAAEAGVLSLLITNPIWVVKTRLCLQYNGDTSLPPSKRYSGMIDALQKIYRLEGFKGFYKGLVPGLFGVSHGAIQFITYEEMKRIYNTRLERPLNVKMSPVEYLACAAGSKLIASVLTYPYQVVRARLQDQHHNYKGTLDCVLQTWRFEGPRGFYKGLSVNLSRVVPATMITFLVYENLIHFLVPKGGQMREKKSENADSK